MNNQSTHDLTLRPVLPAELDQFRRDLQIAFLAGARASLGIDSDEPIPSDEDITASLTATGAAAYHFVRDGQTLGGAIVLIQSDTQVNSLEFFFVHPGHHGQGVGGLAWAAIEQHHPATKVWQTVTPYFEKRNIHFYVNKCGFKITEFYWQYHPDIHQSPHEEAEEWEMFKFEKVMPVDL